VVTTSTRRALPDSTYGWLSPDGKLDWTVPDGSVKVCVSPDRKFVWLGIRIEPYDTHFMMGNFDTDAGWVLLLRSADRSSRYSLCFGCYKNGGVDWSPDSKYLAVAKVYGTHNGDVDVYKVEDRRGASVALDLIFRGEALFLPKGKSKIEWDFKRWDLENNVVVIEKYDQNPNPGHGITTMNISLLSKPIQTLSLTEEPADDQAGKESEGKPAKAK
jgi:hypothetical protein